MPKDFNIDFWCQIPGAVVVMGEESHKKSKIKRRITIRKRMKSTIKIKSNTP